jgi:hypothetical protein
MPGGRGAPLTENEVDLVRESESVALPYLDPEKRQIIQTRGSVEGREGDAATRCVENRDCVFVFYENDIAKCSIERAWQEGKSEFRKPLSCHLFPVRVDDLFGGDHIRYERIPECAPARARGEREDIALLDFLREPLIRAYGEEFYEELLRSRPDGE